MIAEEEEGNFEIFRECLSSQLVAIASASDIKEAAKGKKKTRRQTRPSKAHKSKKSVDRNSIASSVSDGGASIEALDDKKEEGSDGRKEKAAGVGDGESGDGAAQDLAEFVDYLATEIFPSLPDDLRALSYSVTQHDTSLLDTYSTPLSIDVLEKTLLHLPPSATDSLTTYNYIIDPTDTPTFLSPILSSYISSTTAPPPIYRSTRTTECELCDRDWIPLTYHHLIPRQMHAKAIKKGWCEEWELQKVAWLCRACHSFVHRVCSNEELARNYQSVEVIREREDVVRWVKWVGGVRWKKR